MSEADARSYVKTEMRKNGKCHTQTIVAAFSLAKVLLSNMKRSEAYELLNDTVSTPSECSDPVIQRRLKLKIYSMR